MRPNALMEYLQIKASQSEEKLRKRRAKGKMNIGERNQIQGFSARDQGSLEYMRWQNLIEDECQVKCTVRVDLKAISIRTDSYADYVQARSVVRKRTGLEVVRG